MKKISSYEIPSIAGDGGRALDNWHITPERHEDDRTLDVQSIVGDDHLAARQIGRMLAVIEGDHVIFMIQAVVEKTVKLTTQFRFKLTS